MITVGFTLIGRGEWSGGETYQRNMFGVLSDLLRKEIKLKLFLSPQQAKKLGSSLDRFLDGPPIVDARVEGAGEGMRALGALITGKDADFASLVSSHGIDVMFESAQWFGNRFPVPVVSWIPDFQHRHLGHLFPRTAWWKRDIGFRVQTFGRRTIMLSSEDGNNDCKRFFPQSLSKAKVVRFSIDLHPAAVHSRCLEVRGLYNLPDRFFYLPNQFWSHKNHSCVVEALGLLAKRHGRESLPTIILSGRTEDSRNPGHYQKVMDLAHSLGVDSHFKHLGLIPYEDVFALNAAAEILINPSLFEGWSTTVEEAKALGTPLLLSDIPLHREQAPDAVFFAPHSPETLASELTKALARAPRKEPDLEALTIANNRRRQDHADALSAVFKAALAFRLGDINRSGSAAS